LFLAIQNRFLFEQRHLVLAAALAMMGTMALPVMSRPE